MNFFLIATAVQLESAKFDYSNNGVFGFLRHEQLFQSFFLNGFMAGFWGICGYVIACKYYPPIVIMNCLLLEPIVGQTIGVYLKIDKAPGLWTYIGGIIIMLAINL